VARKTTNVLKGEAAVLLDRAQTGDMDAFASLFESLRPMVHAVAYRLTGPNDADDVVMDSYLKAWKSLPRFRRRSSLKTWMYRITCNCAIDCLRSRQRRLDRTVSGGKEGVEWSAIADRREVAPDKALARAETAGAVCAALAKLPAEHRITLELRFVDGMAYAEIAAATRVMIGTVMSRLYYGKRKLRKLLEEGIQR